MKNHNVRTIKITDKLGGPAPSEIELLYAKACGNRDKRSLPFMLAETEKKLADELARIQPDPMRVFRLKEAIANLQHTIYAMQR